MCHFYTYIVRIFLSFLILYERMLRFLCPLYANKSHQRHILLRITGYKWGGTRLVTRYVATVHGSSLATCSRVTVLTCLTHHVCSLYSVTAGSPGDRADGTGITTHGCILWHRITVHGCISWLVVWPGRGRPRHWPTVDSPRPSADCRTTAGTAADAGYIALGGMSNIYTSVNDVIWW